MLILLLSSRQLENISLNDKKIYLNVNFFFLSFLANSNLYLHFLFNYFMNLKKYIFLRLNPVRILGSAFLQGVRKYRRAPYDTRYCLFLIVLWKNYEKNSHWLGLDDLFATSKPNKCEIFL